jgi:hypothetical protein
MKTRFNLGRPTRWLVTANAILALTVSVELLSPAQPGTANAATAGEVEAAVPEFGSATIAAPPFGQLVDMTERPLFFADRRIPQPEVKKAAPPPPKPLRLKLEGIALAGGARVAVLRNLNGNGLLQLAEGESHDGWTLDSLSSTNATFSRDGTQRTELLLDPAGNGQRR